MGLEMRTPGVYWQETFSAPVDGFFTGVPAFLGFAGADAADPVPTDEPRLLTLWPDFEQHFGLPKSHLTDAVRGFFANGGHRCYVVPLDGQVTLETALERGLKALECLDTLDLVCAPDIMPRSDNRPTSSELARVLDMQAALLRHCDRIGDRLAILDASPCASVQAVLEQRKELEEKEPSGTNGALYYPWLLVPNASEAPRWVPPCGHVAGVYAAQDRRVGVHKAPANVALENVASVERDLQAAEQDLLNPEGINAIRAFPGRGIRIFGARTLSRDPNWMFVPVRRVLLTAGRWIQRNMACVVFEPNDRNLWSRIERDLTVYLSGLYEQGALRGATAEQAFYVKCDSDTNPPEVQDVGIVVAELGLAAAQPNEFIIVRITSGAGDMTITTTTQLS